MMLRIQLLPSGDFVDVATDAVATVELFSTIMNKESELLGSYSYPFSLPLTDRNKRLLKNAHLISTSQSLRTLDARLWLGVAPWKKVKLVFCIKGGKIEATLYIDNGIVATKLKAYKLNNITDGFPSTAVHFNTLDAYRAYMKATASAQPGAYPMVFFPIRNEHFLPEVDSSSQTSYPDYAFPQSKYINEWDAVNQQFVVDVLPGNKKAHLEAPLYYLAYIIRQAVKYLGYQLTGNWINDPDVQRLVLNTPIGQNTYSDVSIPDFVSFMPTNITLADFFKAVRSKFSLLIAFNESDKTCLIESWQNIFSSTAPLDLRPYQLKGTDDNVPVSAGYTVTEKIQDTDELYKDNSGNTVQLNPIIIGDGSTGVEMAISTTHMLTENAPGYGSAQVLWRIPHVDQHYYTNDKYIMLDDINFADARDFELRVLYYHGLVKNQNGDLYPYGSADNLDYLNRPLTSFSLTTNADSSTIVMAKAFYEFCMNSKKLEINYLLPKYAFLQISNDRPVLVRDQNNAVVTCLIDQLSADLECGHTQYVYAKGILYARPFENNATGVIPTTPVETPVENGPVYVKMRRDLPKNVSGSLGDMRYRGTTTIIYAQFYEDAAGTIPKSVTNLLVLFQSERHDNLTDEFSVTPNSRECSGTEAMLTGQIYTSYIEEHRVSGVQFETTINWDDAYSLVKTGDYDLVS